MLLWKNVRISWIHLSCTNRVLADIISLMKRSVFIPIPKKGNAKKYSNYYTIVLISHASKVMLNILQARLQQYLIWEISDVEAGFRKDRRTRDQFTNIYLITEKARELQKSICYITTLKSLTLVYDFVVNHNKLENS